MQGYAQQSDSNVNKIIKLHAAALGFLPLSTARDLRSPPGPVRAARVPQGLAHLGMAAGPSAPRQTGTPPAMARSPERGGAGGGRQQSAQVMAMLQSLTPDELNSVEAAFRWVGGK